jgi:hypothetical protein
MKSIMSPSSTCMTLTMLEGKVIMNCFTITRYNHF